MKTLPRISNYGRYESDNYGAHTLKVNLPTITLFYSYNTIVAFSTPETGLVVSENHWSVTTGKHLNWIDDGRKDTRLPADQFDKALEQALEKHIV